MELEELEAIVAEDPNAVEPFLVYADHLQQRGDVRGELIALQAYGRDVESQALLARHRERCRASCGRGTRSGG